jgi:hypothetical protein
MTITVQMLQTRKGTAGADLLVGNTYDLDNNLAIDLVGKKFATDVHNVISLGKDANADNGLVATPAQVAALAAAGTPVSAGTLLRNTATSVVYGQSDGLGGYAALGSGGSGGITTSSGSDMTAATVTGGLVTAYTAGVQWVITRDGSNLPLTQYLLGDVTLKSDLTHAGSGIYIVSGGLKFISGALSMTLAQRNTWVALTPSIAIGFRIFVNDVGSFTDVSGNTVVPGGHQTWRGAIRGFSWDYPIWYVNQQTTSTISTSDVVGRTWTIPATVASGYSDVRVRSRHVFTAAGTSTAVRWFMNANALFSATYNPTIEQELMVLKTLFSEAPSLQHIVAGTGTPYDYTGALTAALVQYTTNYATTPLVMEMRYSGGSGGTTHTVRSAAVCIDDSRTF